MIPAYNEAATIKDVARSVRRHISKVIVVNDGSTDATALEAASGGASMVISIPVGLGYDGALNQGFLWASGPTVKAEIIVTLDGDGEHDPADIPLLIWPIMEGRADIVVGERPSLAHCSEAVFAFYTKLRFGINDPLCGFKAYRREVYDAVGFFDSSRSIGTELMLRGVRKGYRVVNVPIRLHPRQGPSRFYSSSLRGNMRILMAMVRGMLFGRHSKI